MLTDFKQKVKVVYKLLINIARLGFLFATVRPDLSPLRVERPEWPKRPDLNSDRPGLRSGRSELRPERPDGGDK